MKKITLILTVIILLCTFSNAVKAQTIIPAEVPHTYDVTPDGAFSYSVPLRIPPGIKNMMPKLAITYNSNSGNGLMGVGWSISGLSSITRGLPSIYHNGAIHPVDLNSDDEYFLDGQRLLGSSTYLTEVKNFANIQSHGTAGNGPSYFTVEYPDGTIYEYGNTIGNSSNSKMLAQGKSTVLMWPVNRITDIHGNYITFKYTNSQSTGEYRIEEIEYGNNDNTGAGVVSKILFDYTSRIDENETYLNGSEILDNKLLDNIEVKFSDGSQANKYQFTYDNVIVSRLIKIEELRDGITVLSPININWGTSGNEAAITSGFGATNPKNRNISGDFDGDGLTDLATILVGSSTTQLDVFMNSSGTGLSYTTGKSLPLVVTTVNILVTSSEEQSRQVIDYDGDGMDDIILMEHLSGGANTKAYKIWLVRANGTSTVFDDAVLLHSKQNSFSDNDNFHELLHVTTGDYDGDGKSEIIVFAPYHFNTTAEVVDYEVYVIGDEYGSHQINHVNVGHISSLYTMDFNADGRDEFIFTHLDNIVHSATTWGLNLSYNSTTLKPQLNQTPTQWPIWDYGTHAFPNKNDKCWYGDYNGDGKSDVITWDGSTGWSITYSDGVEAPFSNPVHWGQVVSNTSHPLSALSYYGPGMASTGGVYGWYQADFNGDGLCDFLQIIRVSNSPDTYEYKMFYSTGMSFYQVPGTLVIDAHTEMNVLGDFNGDAQIDMLCSRYTPIQLVTFRGNDNTQKVTSIDHIGKSIYADYTTLAKHPNYVQHATGNSDFGNRTLSLKVVENLSDNVSVNNTYAYEGLMYHKYGLGMRGFKKFIVTNNIGQKTYQEYDLTSNQHPYITSTQVFDAWSSMPYGKLTTYQYIDEDGGANGKSRIVTSSPAETIDYITGEKVERIINTGQTGVGTVFYEFGKIESTELYQKDLTGNSIYGMQTTTYDYGTSWATNKGKPEEIVVYKEKDPNGLNGLTRTTEYTYDSYGSVATVTSEPGSPNEKVTTYTYDPDYGNVIKEEVIATGIANPIITEYQYTNDGRFRTYKIEDADPGSGAQYISSNNYGDLTQLARSWGNILSSTNIKGNTTEYEYDILNRVTKVVDNTKQFETYTDYSWASSSSYSTSNTDQSLAVTTTNNSNSALSIIITDKLGRKIRTVDPGPGGQTIEDFTYTIDGKLETFTNPYFLMGSGQKLTTTISYDNYDRETLRVTDYGGQQIGTSYAITNGILHTTTTNIGANNRTKTTESCGDYIKRIYNAGYTEDITYTYHGNGTTALTFSNGMIFENVVDNYGRVTEIIQPNATNNKQYTYDALDRIDIETLTNGVQYQYTYDNLGRVLTKQELGSGLPPYKYVYGNTTGYTDAGDIMSAEAPNGNKVEYTYHNTGELLSIIESNGLQNYTGGAPFTTNYYYNNDGTVERITYMGDMSVKYDYNATGGLSNVYLESSPLFGGTRHIWNSGGYNAYGQSLGAYFFDPLGNQLYTVSNFYDYFGNKASEYASNTNYQAGPFIKDISYNTDVHTGNIIDRQDNLTGNIESFSYDAYFDRLTAINITPGNGNPPSSVDMDYDQNNTTGGSLGNISKKTDVAEHVIHTGGKEGWKYDDYALNVIPDPNVVSTIPQFTQDVDYYNFQKIKSIEEALNNRVEFEYNADDVRSKADFYDLTSGSPTLVKTNYYAKNYEYTIDKVTGNTLHKFYIWAEGEPIAIIEGTQSSPFLPQVADVYYVLTDYLGSITHILDDNGTSGTAGIGIVEERSYDAWGRVRDPQTWQPYATGTFPGNWKTDRGYTGQEHIWLGSYDNNVINLNGRLYDPLVGRMFSPDPYIPNVTNSQDYNKYIYARNNPLKYTDPDGEWVQIAVGAAVGGYVGYKIGAAKGATGGAMASYIVGGALVGAVSGGVGMHVASAGGIAANTLGIVASSSVYSMGMHFVTGGDASFGINFGIGSIRNSDGFYITGLWDWNNLTTAEKLGYTFGALANIQDLAAFGSGTSLDLKSRPKLAGHSEIKGKNITISVGPNENPFEGLHGMKWEYAYFKRQLQGKPIGGRNASFIRDNDPRFLTKLYNVNENTMIHFTKKLNGGQKLLGSSKLIYGLNNGCVNFTSRALLYSGVINFNAFLPLTAPVLLSAEIGLRNAGIYAAPYLVNIEK